MAKEEHPTVTESISSRAVHPALRVLGTNRELLECYHSFLKTIARPDFSPDNHIPVSRAFAFYLLHVTRLIAELCCWSLWRR